MTWTTSWKRELPGYGAAPVIGLLFAAAVVGLLIYLHTETVQIDRMDQDSTGMPVKVCAGAPDWAQGPELVVALKWWAEHGHGTQDVEHGPCSDICGTKDGPLPCERGMISVALREQPWKPGHVAFTYISDSWAIVTVPDIIEQSDPTETVEQVPLRSDIKALVLTHELGHAFGYGHEYTDLPGGAVAHKTGHVMHPELEGLGWGDDGLRN